MKKILLVEDNADLALNLAELLGLHGFDVSLARNGADALEKIDSNPPDIIVSDIRMPGITGIELLKTLKEEKKYRKIPFIFISAIGDAHEVREIINLGADDYLPKPFSFKLLVETINARLNRFAEIVTPASETKAQPQSLIPTHFDFEHLLTPRELEITRLAAKGMSATDISAALFLSRRTVENHKYNILKKLNVEGHQSLSRVLLKLEAEKG